MELLFKETTRLIIKKTQKSGNAQVIAIQLPSEISCPSSSTALKQKSKYPRFIRAVKSTFRSGRTKDLKMQCL